MYCRLLLYLLPDGMEVDMAMIQCPECHKEISDAAYDCPGCGCPLKRRKQDAPPVQAARQGGGGFWLFFKNSLQVVVIILLLLLISVFVMGFLGAGKNDGAPSVSSGGDMSAEKAAALMLNLNGHLCAEVVRINPLKQAKVYEVRCIEYRGGTGTVDYVLDMNTGVGWRR